MELSVNGLKVDAQYTNSCINDVLLPLVKKLENIQKEKERKIIIYLAGAPGCGKSTLALYLEYLSNKIQSLSMDGFHFDNEYLNTHYRKDGTLLAKHKGAIDTFNIEDLTKHFWH